MHRLSCSETCGIFPYKRLTLSPALARGFLPTLPPGKSLKLKIKVAQSCLTLCDLMDYSLPGSFVYGILQARILGWVASRSLLQGIFPTQGMNPGLLHCRLILYYLSRQGNTRILEWTAYPFSSGSSQASNRNGVSCFAGRFFTSWATREAQGSPYYYFTFQFLNEVWHGISFHILICHQDIFFEEKSIQMFDLFFY